MEFWLCSFSTFLVNASNFQMGVDVVITLDLLVALIQARVVVLITMVDVKAKDKVEEVVNKVSWFDPTLNPI